MTTYRDTDRPGYWIAHARWKDPLTDEPRQKRKRGFRTEADAQAWEADHLYAVRHRLVGDAGGLTLGVWLEQWLETLATYRKATTVDSYRRSIRAHVPAKLSRKRLDAVEGRDLDRVYARMLRDGKSPGTIRLVHAPIAKACKDAVKKGLLGVNPALAATLPTDHAVQHGNAWTAEEAQVFLAIAETTPHHALLRTALDTGARLGELLGLRWNDVDLDTGVIRIGATLSRVKGEFHFTTPKTTRGKRSVRVGAATLAVLRGHRRTQLAWRMAVGPGWHEEAWGGWVFSQDDGHPLIPASVSQYFQRLVARHKLRRITFHDLRHTSITLLLQARVDIGVVSKRVGHSSVDFTRTHYQHVLPDQQEEVADTVDRLLGGLAAGESTTPKPAP